MLPLNTASALPDISMRVGGTPSPAGPAPSPGQDFASLLGRLANETASAVKQGEAVALAGMQGALPLQTVVDRVMAAERTLQAALAVRDKAVSAFQEVSRMQI